MSCPGDPNYFIVDCIGVESEGKVFVLALCRHCDDFKVHEVTVSKAGSPIRLLREEKNANKE
jgi:hypothetical protein